MKCKYCGQPAGFFSRCHEACEQKHREGLTRLRQVLDNCFRTGTDFYRHDAEIRQITSSAYITSEEQRDLYTAALDAAVEGYLQRSGADAQAMQTVSRFMQYSGLPQEALNAHHSLDRLLQDRLLQDLRCGRLPQSPIKVSGPFPFMLAKTERLIWLFRGITLYQQRVRREYVGRSRGMTFRVMKGVYYRTGGSRGHAVESTYMQPVGTGSVCLTDKALYFSSPEKSLKVPYAKILSLEPFSNGLSVQKDGARELPFFLEGIEAAFTMEVIETLRP